jgi:hypothetical protein
MVSPGKPRPQLQFSQSEHVCSRPRGGVYRTLDYPTLD